MGFTAFQCAPSLANGGLEFADGTRSVLEETVRYMTRADRTAIFELELAPGIGAMPGGVAVILSDLFGWRVF